MSDNHQADLLARWLSEAGRGEVPDALDEDVQETIFALRPDLAPAPRVDIDDIFDAIEDGPFAVGSQLAGWLDGGDDEGVDEDLREAMFALRPDLAPAPRVNMDDIFGAVTQGPFAQPAIEAAPVVSLAAARQAREQKRRSWWALPGIGAIAAAAAALLMVNPAIMNLPEPNRDLAMERSVMPAAPAAAPMAASAPEEDIDMLADDMSDARNKEPLQQSVKDVTVSPKAAEIALDNADLASGAPVGGAPSALKPAEQSSARITAAAEPPPPPEPAVVEALEALGYVSDLPEAEPAPDDGFTSAPEGAAMSEGVAPSSRPSRTRDREGLGLWPKKEVQSADEMTLAEPEPMEESRAEDFDERGLAENTVDTVPAMPGVGQGAILDRLRASAWSLQPVPDVGAKYPELATAYTAADAEWNAGRMDSALGMLAPFAAHPDPDVVLDVTWNHAQMRYRMGEVLGALEVVEKGLRVSGGNSLLRSRLYALQGQLLERRGQPEQAILSYRQAIEVR